MREYGIVRGMASRGSRTKTTDTWLLPEDEVLLGDQIRQVLPAAAWMCSQPGPADQSRVHLHPTVEAALGCGAVQAFLPLPDGATPPDIALAEGLHRVDGPPHHAIVQLWRSRILTDGQGEHFRCGRLAVSWIEPEVGPHIHQILADQTKLIWAALRAATQPAAIEDSAGRRTAGMRIGPAACALVTARQLPLSRGGQQRYRLAET